MSLECANSKTSNMIWIVGTILTIAASAFVFYVFFGKPSKDEPMEETKITELDEHEIFWHKKENV